MISTSSISGDCSFPLVVIRSAALLAARQGAHPRRVGRRLVRALGKARGGLGDRRVGASRPADAGRPVAGVGVDVGLLQPLLPLAVASVEDLLAVLGVRLLTRRLLTDL